MKSRESHSQGLKIVFSIAMLLCAQFVCADSAQTPMRDGEVLICKNHICGDIKLTKVREEIKIQNDSLAPITIREIHLVNNTQAAGGASPFIESETIILPVTLESQGNYTVVINGIKQRAANNASAEVQVIYDDNVGGKNRVVTANLTFPFSREQDVEKEALVVNLAPLEYTVPYYFPNPYQRGTRSAVSTEYSVSKVYNEEQFVPIGEGVYVLPVGAGGNYKPEYIRPTVETIDFEQPGIKRITLVNKWHEEITLLGVFFDIKKTSAVQTARSLVVQGFEAGRIVPGGGTHELQIQAEENASSSIEPEGNHFFVAYKVKVGGKDEVRYSEFKVKVSYNEDVGFYERNLLFDGVGSKELYLRNKNNAQDIKIKQIGFLSLDQGTNFDDISLTQETSGVHIQQHDCSFLKKGGANGCRAVVTVDQDAKDNLVPVYVKYDICDSSDGVCREVVAHDVIATAVIAVSKNQELADDKDVVAADDNSFVEVAEIIANKVLKNRGSNGDENKKGSLGYAADIARSILNGMSKEELKVMVKKVVGFGYISHDLKNMLNPWFVGLMQAGFVNEEIVNKPEKGYINTVFAAAGKAGVSWGLRNFFPVEEVLRGIKTGRLIPNSKVPTFLATLGCDAPANIVGLWIELHFFHEGKYLPENWDSFFMRNQNAIINTVVATVKVGCLGALGYATPGSATIAILGETIAGLSKDYNFAANIK